MGVVESIFSIGNHLGVAPRSIFVPEDHGEAEGYVVGSEREQLPNWLDKHGLRDPELVGRLRSEFPVVAFLNNINVDEGARGKGRGTCLFGAFAEEASSDGADAILLIADTAEDNEFNLVEWYQRLGFELIAQTGGGPLMLLRL